MIVVILFIILYIAFGIATCGIFYKAFDENYNSDEGYIIGIGIIFFPIILIYVVLELLGLFAKKIFDRFM